MKRFGSLLAWVTWIWCSFAAPAASQTKADDAPRFHAFVNGLYNTQSFRFTDARTTPLYLEEASSTGAWSRQTGAAFGAGATVRLFGPLAVGVAFEMFSASPSESLRASLPHPLYFNQNRSLEAEAAGLSYDEKAVHFLLAYTRVAGRFVVALSGGPSYFMTKTEIIDDFTFTEAYPFDDVALSALQPRTYDSNRMGFNAGAWLGVRLMDQLAVGGDFRYSRARPRFTTAGGNEIELDAGGLRVGAGLRLLF